jgi:hypothetical protein
VQPQDNEPVIDAQAVLMSRAHQAQFGEHGDAEADVLARLEDRRLDVG